MVIHVRNMVCNRCISSVRRIFEAAAVNPLQVTLGAVELQTAPAVETQEMIRKELEKEGFEWIDDQRVKMVEQVKTLILELVHYGELDEMKVNLSQYLSSHLHKEYHYLSSLFSSLENTTIEQYFILQKIEKVKEWLVYNEFTLGEMAFKLGYSSVAHLSGQFKKVTGFSPSQFRSLKDHHRKPLDQVGK